MQSVSLRRLTDDGLLFEINRRVLHPLGLALALQWDGDDASGEPDGVQLLADSDPEGTVFAPETFVAGVSKVEAFMEREGTARLDTRQKAVGFIVQEVAEVPEVPK